MSKVTIHKSPSVDSHPLVSVVLLDWSVRERFQALEWLQRQDVPRDNYELIWVEMFSRVAPEAMAAADMVITCGQEGLYHKHEAINLGILHARGVIVTVADSDAIFPPTYIRSILDSFHVHAPGDEGIPLVLMHHEWRTGSLHPKKLNDLTEIEKYQWRPLWPNVGASFSMRVTDAIRGGGWDEHETYRGYMAGADLVWRLVNMGIPEVWHDEAVALWHFAHPDPFATFDQKFSWKRFRENAHPHVDSHPLTAVEAFSTGRLLPLKENPEFHRRRMASRVVGSTFEEKYATYTGPEGFSKAEITRLRIKFLWDPLFSPQYPLGQEWGRIKFRTNHRVRYSRVAISQIPFVASGKWLWRQEYAPARFLRRTLFYSLLALQKCLGPEKYRSIKASVGRILRRGRGAAPPPDEAA